MSAPPPLVVVPGAVVVGTPDGGLPFINAWVTALCPRTVFVTEALVEEQAADRTERARRPERLRIDMLVRGRLEVRSASPRGVGSGRSAALSTGSVGALRSFGPGAASPHRAEPEEQPRRQPEVPPEEAVHAAPEGPEPRAGVGLEAHAEGRTPGRLGVEPELQPPGPREPEDGRLSPRPCAFRPCWPARCPTFLHRARW